MSSWVEETDDAASDEAPRPLFGFYLLFAVILVYAAVATSVAWMVVGD